MDTQTLVRLIEAARSGSRNKPMDGDFYVMSLEDMERFANLIREYDKDKDIDLYSGFRKITKEFQ